MLVRSRGCEMDSILMSAKPQMANVEEAKNFLTNHNTLYWEVPFDIKKSNFEFPIKCYIHVSGTDNAEYMAIVQDIIPHNPSHYYGKDAHEHKPASWIQSFINNPSLRGYFKFVLIMSNISNIKPLDKNSILKRKEKGQKIRGWPQKYTDIIDPLEEPTNQNTTKPTSELVACDIYETEEKEVVIRRVLRDTVLVQDLKIIYDDSCQICNKQINLGNCTYSEAHHLQPLGKKKHNGPDIKENIIILCPNHHAEFDLGAIGINPDTMEIEHVNTHDSIIGRKLTLKHNLGKEYVVYHYMNIFRH